jgi:acetyl esterase
MEEAEFADPEAMKMYERSAELQQKDDDESNKEFTALLREACAPYADVLKSSPKFKDSVEKTITTSLKVPTTHDGDFEVPVEVYTPKDLESEQNRVAYVYAHGGGGVAMCAADFDPMLKHCAVELSVVVFNVDYRIAPETQCPNNVKDFYEAIKYVSKNAESLGVDPSKIVIAGDSGGGYICLGAMVMLVQSEESDLVKLAIPGVPMVDDYCFSDPLAMTVEERAATGFMRKTWKLIAADFEQQKTDPLLFPGKASDDILGKFPPTIIMECEFDQYITEATRLAHRLRRAGRLLEFVVVPGAGHASCMTPHLKSYDVYFDSLKTIVKEYILCNDTDLTVAIRHEFNN